MSTVVVKQPKSFIKLVGNSLSVGPELRSLVYHLVNILELSNSCTLDALRDELFVRGVDMIKSNLEIYMHLGVNSGIFKRMRAGSIELYTLNTKKQVYPKDTKKKDHRRPNRGIGASIVNLLNSDKITKLFHVPQIVTALSSAYPSITVRNVEANLRLINRAQPNQLLIDNGTYLVKGPINYLGATK